MDLLRTWWRFLVAVQLLPALEGGEETLVGGQAVLEGVMMRSPHAWAIACRKPSGEVSTHSEPLERLSEKRKWMAWPVVRGVVTLGHAMTLGFRALKFSANVALDELQPEPSSDKKKLEINGWMAAVNIIISVGFFIFMYKFLPLVAATELKRVNPLFGEQIIFMSNRAQPDDLGLYVIRADGSGAAKPIPTRLRRQWPTSILARDGSLLLFGFDAGPGKQQLVIGVHLPSPSALGDGTPVVVTNLFPGVFAEVSPNGRFVAYRSGTGTPAVYVRPFPVVDGPASQIVRIAEGATGQV